MPDAFICDAIRTPIGKLNGGLSSIRADDLAAIPIRELAARNAGVDWETVDDTILGCANQAGEDNRNVARMAVLLAGLPEAVPGTTVNRLCGSGLNAVGIAAQAIRCGDAQFILAGGVESMSRWPMGSDGGAWAMDPRINEKLGFAPQGIGADLIASLNSAEKPRPDGAPLLVGLDGAPL